MASPRSLVPAATILLLVASASLRGQQPPQFTERVDVARTILDVRVLDDRGDVITGLTADDFRVTIDGKPARVETATWVGGPSTAASAQVASTPAPVAGPVPHDEPAPPDQPRLIVFLVQKDNHEVVRLRGLQQVLPKTSAAVLETLTPRDRVAVLSFDTALHVWTDFIGDRAVLARILDHDLLLQRAPAAIQASAAPSLVEHLDASSRKAYDIERALELIGHALEPLPGSKSVVFLAYGMGQLGLGGVRMENHYDAARAALVAARASVFSIDITDADRHSLEAGLQLVAGETGGFYARTNLFPEQAMRQLTGALAGYYALFVENPEGVGMPHDLNTELTRRKGHVLALKGDVRDRSAGR